MFSFTNLSKLLPAALLVLSSIAGLAQSGNQGGIRTTNQPFAGAVLVTDGTIYYWGTPTNLQASVTNAQPPSTTLTNLSATGVAPGATNASAYIGSAAGLGTNTDIKVTLEVFGSVFVETNLFVTNDVTVRGGDLSLIGTSGSDLGVVDYGAGLPQVSLENSNGTEGSPTAITAGGTVGVYKVTGYGDTAQRTSLTLLSKAMSTFTDSSSETLVNLTLGNNSGSGKTAWTWTPYNSTNDANLWIKSNATVNGNFNVDGSMLVAAGLTNEGASRFEGDVLQTSGQATFKGTTLETLAIASPTGAAYANFFEDGWSSYSQFLAPPNIQTNNVNILWSNATSGVTVGQPAGTGTNQIQNIALTPGQYVTYNGTDYVASNLPAGLGGGGPGTLPMNANQFDTNDPVTIKNGALLTNTSIRTALTLPTLTASRAALINGSNQLTNSANVTDTELEFLDGVTSAIQTQLSNDVRVVAGTGGITVTPSGSGGIMTYTVNDDDAGGSGSTNNVVTGQHFTTISNQLYRAPMHLGDTTNIVVSFRTNQYIVAPSNSFTLTVTDLPQSGHKATIEVFLINTNSSAGYFFTNGLNGGSIILLSAPSTNRFLIHSQTNALWVESGQILATGISDIFVMKTNPVIDSMTMTGTNLVNGNIGFIEQYPTGDGGANTNFTLLVNGAASFVINGFTNLSFRALYGGTLGITYTFSIEATNGSGANRTLEFSPVTNNWVWSYAQGGTAPTVLTNSERIVIEGKLRGTNITASYAYFPWP